MKTFEITEAHGNSKVYDKCWKGYRKVKGKKRGEKGSCVKEWSLFGDDEPEVNDKGFPYFTGDEETDLPVVVYILKAYKGREDKTLRYLVKELKYPHVKASLYIIRAQTPGVADKYAKFKPQKPKVKESATANTQTQELAEYGYSDYADAYDDSTGYKLKSKLLAAIAFAEEKVLSMFYGKEQAEEMMKDSLKMWGTIIDKHEAKKNSVKETATAGTTSAGGIASSMGFGNGFANGGPGVLTRAGSKKRKKKTKSK